MIKSSGTTIYKIVVQNDNLQNCFLALQFAKKYGISICKMLSGTTILKKGVQNNNLQKVLKIDPQRQFANEKNLQGQKCCPDW